MPNELPKGWVKTSLGEIAVPSRERALPTESPSMHYVGLEHIEPQTMRLLGHGYARDARSSSVQFSKGDVLYGKMRPYLNKVWVAEFDGACSAEFLVFSKCDDLNSQFLGMRLNAEDFVAFANRQISGDRPRVDFEKLSRFPILLPPIAEQERIAAKLNAVLSGVQRAEMASRRARERLDTYRDAVLNAAVTGELTREWRESQRKSKRINVETGGDLLKRLLAIRRVRWEEIELNRLHASGKVPKDEKWKSRYPEPTSPITSDLTRLPNGWIWASLDQLSIVVRGASPRPAGDPRYFGGEIPWITVGSLTRDSQPYLTQTTETVTEAGKEASRYIEAETLLLTNSGATLGVPKISRIAGCINDGVAALLAVDYPLKLYLYYFLAAQTKNLRNINQGAAQPNLNTSIIRAIVAAVPSSAEQTVIVHEVESRLSAANRLADTLDKKLAKASVMRQSLLREAFSGRLVPQNSSDEPAAVLLERIRSERIRLEAVQREAKARSRRQPKASTRESMKKSLLTQETLTAAFERIGRKADANLLFKEAGCAPDEITTFYETLRATPEVLRAFEHEAGKKPTQKRGTPSAKKTRPRQKGRFLLVELWLEEFKNLKDYTIRFDLAYGLDVVLGWNGTGKSNLFESLVIIFRDLDEWRERNRWPDKPMNGYRLSYEIDQQLIQIVWKPNEMKRPVATAAGWSAKSKRFGKPEVITRTDLPLPRFVFGYYSGPTNRLAEHFQPMNQAHYVRLREALGDDPKTLTALLEQRRFFCAETHHAKYVLLAFCYREDPEINRFLRERLRITGFESALFIIRKPRWAKAGTKANDFWGAKGVMRRVLDRLKRFAIAPMLIEQNVRDGYRTAKEEHYYLFLPDLPRLLSFADEYDDARTFFLALESMDFSELIHDVKIQVRVSATDAQEIPITFREMSEGEQQLLMVLGLMRFTKSLQSLVLLDEPDTHLNPQWSVGYLKLLTKIMSDGTRESDEQQTSQILISTHDPLVIASLVKEQIHLLKRDWETGVCKWVPASVNPRGLGFTGILTSEMFGFRSDLDEETLADLDSKVRLMAKEGELKPADQKKLEDINTRLAEVGFQKAFSDPYYAAFIRAWGRKYSELMAGQQFLSPAQMEEIERVADEVLEEARSEVEKEVVG